VFLAELDRVISNLQRNQLRVIFDVHPSSEFKRRLQTSQEDATHLVALWSALATHFAGSDPERVFFEILNEPEFSDAAQWSALQSRAIAAVRKAAPHHTILATAVNYSGLPDLLTLDPVADDNIIYTFHDYEPFVFTHQGATWTTTKVRPLHAVPYPSTPENIMPLQTQEGSLADQYWLESYGLNRWDAARIRTELAFAAKWGELHHAPVYCGEFGVYNRFADPAMRAAWLRDTRLALEAAGIGWAVWDYQGSFAVVDRQNGRNVPDGPVASALGLSAQ
jgi:endoglucanase